MMARRPLFGLLLAAFGALLISPDTLMMRLSGLEGFAMLAWRGLLTALTLLILWALLSKGRRRQDWASVMTAAGLCAVAAQAANSAVFSLSIAVAPVSVVLFGVATAPVFGALFAWLLLGEPTRRATWIAIATVMSGIALAVSGGLRQSVGFDLWVLVGAVGGLFVAASLALSFVLYRRYGDLSIPLTVGLGSLVSGVLGLALAGGTVTDGVLWPIAVSGLVLLPLTFFALSHAARFTHASNVSLMLLLETVLGPVIVWIGVGEAMSATMILGGVIVVGSLALYLLHMGRQAAPPP